jgi:hypothetical protein
MDTTTTGGLEFLKCVAVLAATAIPPRCTTQADVHSAQGIIPTSTAAGAASKGTLDKQRLGTGALDEGNSEDEDEGVDAEQLRKGELEG